MFFFPTGASIAPVLDDAHLTPQTVAYLANLAMLQNTPVNEGLPFMACCRGFMDTIDDKWCMKCHVASVNDTCWLCDGTTVARYIFIKQAPPSPSCLKECDG